MEGNDLSFQVQLPASVANTKSQMILLREGEFAEKFWKEVSLRLYSFIAFRGWDIEFTPGTADFEGKFVNLHNILTFY